MDNETKQLCDVITHDIERYSDSVGIAGYNIIKALEKIIGFYKCNNSGLKEYFSKKEINAKPVMKFDYTAEHFGVGLPTDSVTVDVDGYMIVHKVGDKEYRNWFPKDIFEDMFMDCEAFKVK